MSEDVVRSALVALFLQLSSWLVWCSVQISVLDYFLHQELSCESAGLVYQPLFGRGWAQVERWIGVILFGVLGLLLNIAGTHPGGFWRAVGVPYLGAATNLAVFGYVLYQVVRKDRLPIPGTGELLTFTAYVIRRNRERRVFAGGTAALLSFAWCLAGNTAV
jgi:hypothetical protein